MDHCVEPNPETWSLRLKKQSCEGTWEVSAFALSRWRPFRGLSRAACILGVTRQETNRCPSMQISQGTLVMK